MRHIAPIVLLLVVAGGVAGYFWWRAHEQATDKNVPLLGNVDLRQVELPFNNVGRIAEVLVQEGDRVKPGQTLARLDTSRLEPQVAQAEAELAAQMQIVLRLHNGSRPEEIAQSRANVESARADSSNARLNYDRIYSTYERSSGAAVSKQDLDNAKSALAVAEAKLTAQEKALELLVIGPRVEDIAEAEARRRANEARLALLRQELADSQLVAPSSAVVRTRVMEPGEMASPEKPVFTLAIIDPKWVRAYVSETRLGQVHPGMKAAVTVDSFPNRKFEGWVGFISPVAEFTPKPVQTEELRTSLVYEVRVFVNDPDDDLRLGMPASVHLPLESPAQPEKDHAPQSSLPASQVRP